MKVELFGWTALIFQDVGKTWYATWDTVNGADIKVMPKFIMFLEFVEFHLRELNNE